MTQDSTSRRLASAPLTNGGWVLSNFAEFERGLNGGATSQFHSVRKDALSRFASMGFPTSADEEWKYTNLGPLVKDGFVLDQGGYDRPLVEELRSKAFSSPNLSAELVFVNGRYISELSREPTTPSGAKVKNLKAALSTKDTDSTWSSLLENNLARQAKFTDNSVVALNTAFVTDGAAILIPKGVAVKSPIHCVFITLPGAPDLISFPRVIVIAEEGAESTIIESFVGSDERYFSSSVTELVLQAGSRLRHVRVQTEGRAAVHTSMVSVCAEPRSNFETFVFNFGGSVVRNEIEAHIGGAGVTGILNGLSVLGAEQHVDNHTSIDHAQPHSQTTERYKGVYSDKSRGVFQGTIIVRPDAQKTNAIQSNQSILLSPDASIDTKPQLKIWADDVKCTHGATVGELDQDALFYLRSRGIAKKDAAGMLVHAFASDIVQQLNDSKLEDYLSKLLTAKLAESGQQ